jgi:hypothetical protein
MMGLLQFNRETGRWEGVTSDGRRRVRVRDDLLRARHGRLAEVEHSADRPRASRHGTFYAAGAAQFADGWAELGGEGVEVEELPPTPLHSVVEWLGHSTEGGD